VPQAKPAVATVTIANGASLSDAIEVGQSVVGGLQVPAIDSAALTFQGSHDGVTYQNCHDSAGAEITIPASAGARFVTAPAALNGVPFLKVRTGTAAAPVNQTAQRQIQVVAK
jgi:hypothetical protein